ncbi:dTDP-glucose 4,6-dehydratase [Halanaerocella petrolearia]
MKTYLVTGGAGFIGANFVKYMLEKYKQDIKLVVLDKLTYAANLGTLKEELDRIEFIKGDICNKELVENIFTRFNINYVVNFAAESHVDRSIEKPQVFLETNVLGTQTLLDIAKKHWTIEIKEDGYPKYKKGVKYLQVSTDEVYGSLNEEGYFTEETPLNPRSPYSASKASSDMLVKAYHDTYKMPVNITRCSNNYGPYQFPEKLIPLMIGNILRGESLPIYGDGKNVRDWLYVEDHCRAINMVLNKGKLGEVYNIGGHNEKENIKIVKEIIDLMREELTKIGKETIVKEEYNHILKTNIENINYDLIKFVKDRLGHDRRYAIKPCKIKEEIGWKPEIMFDKGIVKTIKWYLNNQSWIQEVTSDNCQNYYKKVVRND